MCKRLILLLKKIVILYGFTKETEEFKELIKKNDIKYENLYGCKGPNDCKGPCGISIYIAKIKNRIE